MPLSLVQAALDVKRQGARRTALMGAPLLVWMSPAQADPEEAWAVTASNGAAPRRPKNGESLVFPVVKKQDTSNAFALGITVGRIESNDLCLNDPTISRFHAFFTRDARSGTWFLSDAESDNGTLVGGQKLAKGAKQKLGDDVYLRFGNVEVRFFQPPAFVRYVDSI